MFCWKCGKELLEDARFCTYCGAPAVNAESTLYQSSQTESQEVPTTDLTQMESQITSAADHTQLENQKLPSPDLAQLGNQTASVADTAQPENQKLPLSDLTQFEDQTASMADTAQPENQEPPSPDLTQFEDQAASVADTAQAEGQEPPAPIASQPDSQDAPAPIPVQDLIVRRKRITVTDGRLLIDGTYYWKNGSRYKKKKGQLGVPLSFIAGTSTQRTRCMRRIFASLLLFIIFTAGTMISGYFTVQTLGLMHTPYRQERMKELENDLAQLSSNDTSQLNELEPQLQAAVQELDLMGAQLAALKEQRTQELLQAAVADSSFDTHALFSSAPFADAYRQYLKDLLDAFLGDWQIHDWLYPYYSYSMELGSNPYIEDELYFYSVTEDDSIFSAETKDPETLLQNTYNYDLEQHIYYTGRIYITASDFMNRVLMVPDYVANGAVFVKAYGGNPDPASMDVPGWGNARYRNFWQDAFLYYDAADPIWVYYGFSAEDFGIDWEHMVNEQAYYDAYLKFMETIAPGLGVFDMVAYSAGDDSFGGMYYEITGREASVTEIVTLYIKEHPEYLEELDLDLEAQASVYDNQLTSLERDIERLTARVNELTEERDALVAFFASADSVQAEYNRLIADAQSHRVRLVQNLIIFGCIFVILFLMALISLIVFIRLLKKPKNLMILELKDGTEAAFSISFCPKKKLKALQECLDAKPQGCSAPTSVST